MDAIKEPNKILDFFCTWRWWTAQLVFMPTAIGLMLVALLVYNTNFRTALICFIIGVFSWTLAEYCLHRFLFHFIGQSAWLIKLHDMVHGLHHAYPNNPRRVVFPPIGSMPMALAILGILLLLFRASWAFSILSGFIFGYGWYEFVHYSCHHIKWRVPWFKTLKRHHLLHHHHEAYEAKNYGVTTRYWDRVFGTFLA